MTLREKFWVSSFMTWIRKSCPWRCSVSRSNWHRAHAAASEDFRIATSIHIAVAQFELECYKSSQNIFKCITNNKSSEIPSEQNQIHFNLKFVKPSKLKILLNIRFVVPALTTYAVSFIAALKAWCAVAWCMHRERWIPVPLWRNNITCFWHKSRSLFLTG